MRLCGPQRAAGGAAWPELRVNGKIKEFYTHPEEALDRVRALIRMDCDSSPRCSTRGPAGHSGSGFIRWREELANKIGF